MKMLKAFDHVAGGVMARCFPVKKRTFDLSSAGALDILVIRPGGIGDAVMLLPVIRALKAKGHTVHVLCERRNAGVFISQDGLCASVWRYDVGCEFFKVFRSYDVVVDTEQWHHLSAIVAAVVKSRLSIGFATRPSRARLFDVQVPYDLNEYELRSFARLFKVMGVGDHPVLKGSYHVGVDDLAWAKRVVDGPYIALALGGSIALRRFTLSQAQQICQMALDKGFQVVLLGGKDVADLARGVVEAMKDPRVLDHTGKTTLSQSAALIKGAKRFIGHDSGVLHMARALGIDYTAFFGPSDPRKWDDGVSGKVFRANLSCAPCSIFGHAILRCNERPICMEREIDFEEVF